VVYKRFVPESRLVPEVCAPLGVHDSELTLVPAVHIASFGARDTVLSATFRIEAAYSSTKPVGWIPPGRDTIVAFDPQVLNLPRGRHYTSCSLVVTNHHPCLARDSFRIGVTDAAIAAWSETAVDSGQALMPKALMRGLGTLPCTARVVLRIPPDYSDRESTVIYGGGTLNLSFAPWTATTRGYHLMAAQVFAGRHFRVDSCSLLVRVPDAAAERITWPAGRNVSRGVNYPRVLVRNCGASSQTIPARFSVRDSGGHPVYEDSTGLRLTAGARGTAVFRPWDAASGSYAGMTCTDLANDVNHANDSAFGVFRVERDPMPIERTFLYPGDTIPPGSHVPFRAWLANRGAAPAHLQVFLYLLRGGFIVYASETLSALLPAGAGETLDLKPWQSEPGNYAGSLTTLSDSESYYDELPVHIYVHSGAVEEAASADLLPKALALDPAQPNPFRHRAVVCYSLPEDAEVSLRLFDAAGRVAANLFEGRQPAGHHSVVVFPGNRLAPGVYFCRLAADGRTAIRRMTVIGP
jgi:hypothetical protein